MSTDTPMTDAIELLDRPARHKALWDKCAEFERENARLREEIEMLETRHAAAMLHAQTHADEYNALREDEKGLLQDIQRLTEEAFKRDEELAEAKRKSVGVERDNNNLAKDLLGVRQLYSSAQQMLLEAEDRSIQHFGAAIQEKTKREQAEARALANEKDAGRLRWLLEDHEHPATRELRNSLLNRMQVMSYSAACTDIDAAIAGAKHD